MTTTQRTLPTTQPYWDAEDQLVIPGGHRLTLTTREADEECRGLAKNNRSEVKVVGIGGGDYLVARSVAEGQVFVWPEGRAGLSKGNTLIVGTDALTREGYATVRDARAAARANLRAEERMGRIAAAAVLAALVPLVVVIAVAARLLPPPTGSLEFLILVLSVLAIGPAMIVFLSADKDSGDTIFDDRTWVEPRDLSRALATPRPVTPALPPSPSPSPSRSPSPCPSSPTSPSPSWSISSSASPSFPSSLPSTASSPHLGDAELSLLAAMCKTMAKLAGVISRNERERKAFVDAHSRLTDRAARKVFSKQLAAKDADWDTPRLLVDQYEQLASMVKSGVYTAVEGKSRLWSLDLKAKQLLDKDERRAAQERRRELPHPRQPSRIPRLK
ncbi:uncharacterized protein LOC62_05G007144 [Vanrija pseudolonga]|uniref:Uncharacterized protein n=1 Tax=Vanrija pseudolonga TaxID=143232 RepID=A0AAF1BNW4_9TREE|nr:hypothetical protein LOC62_05G007144 [Vanrija pseudolonga]